MSNERGTGFWDLQGAALFSSFGTKDLKCFQASGDVASGQAAQPSSPGLGQAQWPWQDICLLWTLKGTVEMECIKQQETQ